MGVLTVDDLIESFHIVSGRPRADDAEGWYGLDVIEALLPIIGYLKYAPPRLRLEARVAMSWRLWTVLKFTKFRGASPVDPDRRKVCGLDVQTHEDWPFERVEILLPVAVKVHDRG